MVMYLVAFISRKSGQIWPFFWSREINLTTDPFAGGRRREVRVQRDVHDRISFNYRVCVEDADSVTADAFLSCLLYTSDAADE